MSFRTGNVANRIHVVGACDPANGMFVAASLMARDEGAQVLSCAEFQALVSLSGVDEVVVHGCWLPCYWKACWKVLRSRTATGSPRLARMTHGNMDPVRLGYHGWKKSLVAPVERGLFAACDRILVTGDWEKAWCERWGLKGPFDVVDLMRFFSFRPARDIREPRTPHVLYLGRRHPLKGLRYLESALAAIARPPALRIVSDHAGETLARDWEWCDVLCLPTLSENFGLVVAEALERGKRVITTDGAPAWDPSADGRLPADGRQLVYLRGFRDGTDAARVDLLKQALVGLECGA